MTQGTDNVGFTYEAPGTYARIECVGQYLLAAKIIESKLHVIRQNIEHLVDFGCGAGKSTRAAINCVRQHGILTGIDVSAAMIFEAQRLTTELRDTLGDVQFRYLQIAIAPDGTEHVPLTDGTADAVTSTIVFQELQTRVQLRGAIDEIARILRPDGPFVAVCVSDKITCEDFTAFTYAPFPENSRRRTNYRKCQSVVSNIVWERDRHWSQRTLVSLLRQAGLEISSVEYPLADPTVPPFPADPLYSWKDELHSSPFIVIVSRKR